MSDPRKGKHYSVNTEFKKGSGGFTGKHTEETKKKISLAKFKGEQRKCPECEVVFRTSPSHNKKYCSVGCWSKQLSERCVGENNGFWRGGLPTCVDCGKQLSNRDNNRCNPCNGKFRGRGITSMNRLERLRFRRTTQKKVFERDNYTCQMCNQMGGNLHVDHIQPWAEYVEGRFSMDNCRTLCMKCHYKITFNREIPQDVKAWGHNLFRVGVN